MTAAVPSTSGAAGESNPRIPAQPAAPHGELDLPLVPHMFVQRVDALPEQALELALASLGRLEDSPIPPASSGQRPGWLNFMGWGTGGGAGGGRQPPSKTQLREVLQRRRREELAADADTADYSSEPFDSIPRQVQLQWRVFAKLYPEEAAASGKLASLLSSREDRPPQSQAAGDNHSRGGPGTLFGALPTASELQRTLQGLTRGPHAATAPAAYPPPREKPHVGGGDAATTAAPPKASPAGRAGAGSRDARVPDVIAAARDDPTFKQLNRSLDRWYELHWEETAPLRRGRKARLLAVRGVGIPDEWKVAMRRVAPVTVRPSEGGVSRELLRWGAAAASAAAGAVGLRCRPQLWEVDAGGGDARRRQAQEEPQGSAGAARGRAWGHKADQGGRGLVAAQAALLRMSFTLRKTTLIPPDWL